MYKIVLLLLVIMTASFAFAGEEDFAFHLSGNLKLNVVKYLSETTVPEEVREEASERDTSTEGFWMRGVIVNINPQRAEYPPEFHGHICTAHGEVFDFKGYNNSESFRKVFRPGDEIYFYQDPDCAFSPHEVILIKSNVIEIQ